MPTKVHELVEQLKERTIKGDLQFGTIPGTRRADFEWWCEDFSGLIARQKFDFGTMLDSLTTDAALHAISNALIKDGLWKLSYPAVWFEGVSLFSGGAGAGVYCYVDPRDAGKLWFVDFVYPDGNWWFNGWITVETPLRLTTAPTNTLKLMRVGWVRYHEDALRTHECAIRLVLNAVAALSARHVTVRTEPAPDRLNKKRAEKGRPPLFEHRVVTIDRTAIQQMKAEQPNGCKSSVGG